MTSNSMILRRKEWGSGFGTMGQKISVVTNCFTVTPRTATKIQQYDVTWSNEKIKDKREVMHYLVTKAKIFGKAGMGAAYDGVAIMYIPGDVPGPPIEFSFNEGVARGRPGRPGVNLENNLTVHIKHSLTINLLELAGLIQGNSGLNPNLNQALNALNVAIKYYAQLENPSRKATFYRRPSGRDPPLLGAGLEAWNGYFTTIRPGIGQVIMNFDRAAGAFKQPGNAINVLLELLRIRDPSQLEIARMPPRPRLQLRRYLKNALVRFKHARDPNAKFKIRKVSDEGARDFMFDLGDGRRDNVASYIEKKYEIKLRFPALPCVQLTKIAWYPLELIEILPGTQFLGKLSPDQVTAMLKHTTMKPAQALGYLREGLEHLKLGQENVLLRAWNMEVASSSPIKAKARVLDAPHVIYADGRGTPAPQQARDGQWDTRGKKALKPGKSVTRWVVVVFAEDNPGRDGFQLPQVQSAVSGFVRGCREWGVVFNNERPTILHVGPTMEVARAIRDAAQRAGYGPQAPPEFVLTFIPTKSSPQYSLIKQACEKQFNVPSQNLLIQKMAKANPQYWSNVALKVNVKLGGINQYAGNQNGWLPGFDAVPTIVFGADVTHPGPGSLLPSIAGVVASYDRFGTQYATEVRAQNSREEMIMDLGEIAFNLIKNYGNKTGTPPQRILFYRDGVADSQFDQVCRDEISALKGCFAKLKKGYNPSVCYIICGKRHHIRMYPANPGDADRSQNCRAGTVIDHDICHPFYSDFYLMSHGGLLGTSRPCHYSVLLDEAKLGPDQLQATTYHLAYIYARSTRSVSIASPAYYAHHVCTRARAHIGDDDSATTEMGSTSPEQMDQLRNQNLANAIQRLGKGVAENLQGSLYFM